MLARCFIRAPRATCAEVHQDGPFSLEKGTQSHLYHLYHPFEPQLLRHCLHLLINIVACPQSLRKFSGVKPEWPTAAEMHELSLLVAKREPGLPRVWSFVRIHADHFGICAEPFLDL